MLPISGMCIYNYIHIHSIYIYVYNYIYIYICRVYMYRHCIIYYTSSAAMMMRTLWCGRMFKTWSKLVPEFDTLSSNLGKYRILRGTIWIEHENAKCMPNVCQINLLWQDQLTYLQCIWYNIYIYNCIVAQTDGVIIKIYMYRSTYCVNPQTNSG